MRIEKDFRQMKKGVPVIILGLFVGLIVGISSYIKILTPANGFIYDHLLVSFPKLKTLLRPNLIIIQANNKFRMASDNTWLTLLTEIEKQGPKAIVFTFLPTEVSKQFYEEAKRYGNVIFGRRIEISPDDENNEALEPWPESAKGIELPFGVVQLPDSDNGIYRSQQRQVNINNQWYPTVEVIAANHVLKTNVLLNTDKNYRIDFSRGKDSLPVLSLEQVTGGNLIPSLIKEKVVLIGISNTAGNFLYTPLMTKHLMLTPLQFYGYSLETLLSNNAITSTNNILNITLFIAIMLLNIFALQKMAQKWQFSFLIVLLMSYTIITWFLLEIGRIWLPAAELYLTQILIWSGMIYYQYKLGESGVQKAIIDVSYNLQHRSIPEYFYNSEEPWAKINDMVSQFAHTSVSIFMECDKQKHKLKVITALGFDQDKINEHRRDYRRKPYSTAIENQGLTEVDNFIKDSSSKKQYIMPLIFLNEVQGFWLFNLDKQSEIDENKKSYLNNLGKKIAELLYYREQWFEQKKSNQNSFSKYFNLNLELKFFQNLENVLTLAERQFTVMDDYLDHASIASIVYDLFGRPIIVNKKMLSLLGLERIYIYKMSMIELIRSLTGVTEDVCRSIFQSLLFDKEELKLDVTFPNQPEKYYILNLVGINTNIKKSSLNKIDNDLVERQGFLCELIDVTEIRQAYNLKDTVRKHLGYRFRNDLASILFAISLLEKDSVPDEKRKRFIEILRNKSNAIVEMVDEAEELFSVGLTVSQIERYPVDLNQAINNTILLLNDDVIKKDIRFVQHFPDVVKLVYASPNPLEMVLTVLIKYLLLDSKKDTEIIIKCETNDNNVSLTLKNNGYGMPNELFQMYLSNASKDDESKNFGEIKQSVSIVVSWDGTLLCKSEVGVGTTFILTLKGYL